MAGPPHRPPPRHRAPRGRLAGSRPRSYRGGGRRAKSSRSAPAPLTAPCRMVILGAWQVPAGSRRAVRRWLGWPPACPRTPRGAFFVRRGSAEGGGTVVLRSILIGLDTPEHVEVLTELGIRWARRFGASLAGLAIIDESGIRAIEPHVPVGGKPGVNPVYYMGYENRMAECQR